MFVLEQEEYLREGIDWAMVDFGMDLQACITMFEKPMGVLAILEEESLFPKATDKSFEEKLKSNHLGKSPNMCKPSTKTDKNAHFAVIHYAATVSYNVTGWLEKNKDPLNDTVVELLKSGSNSLVVHIFADHPGQGSPDDKGKGGKGKKGKGGGGKTVSSTYKIQLDDLMSTLHATEPHFIRCIVPNHNKMPGEIDSALVLHQLTCNGVLEGIRICMRGFPNRMQYPEFCSRYTILNGAKVKSGGMKDPKKICEMICSEFIDKERFRIGHTKVFFRAGVLGYLEEVRDDIVLKLTRWMQGACYGILRRRAYAKRLKQRELVVVVQRNFRKFLSLRNWGWFNIIQKTKPLIGMINIEEEIRMLEANASKASVAVDEEERQQKRLDSENTVMQEEMKKMQKKIELEQGDLVVYQERQAKAAAQKADLENQLYDNETRLEEEENKKNELQSSKRALESELDNVKRDSAELESHIIKAETEKASRDHSMRSLNDDIGERDEIISRLNKEKKYLQENSIKAIDDLQGAEDRVQHLNMVKGKLEQTMDDLEDTVEREKRGKVEADKQKRKVEGELKVQQEMVADMERSKKEMESAVQRRERDIAEMQDRLEQEQAVMGKFQRHIKETQARVEEMEEELEAERQARAKAERQKADLSREMDELSERLEEACGATTAQMELNKKREMEVHRMRKDLEEAAIQQESTILSLKKKHQDAIGEMSEQMDQLSKLKVK
jgi:myosin heavy chain 6/7